MIDLIFLLQADLDIQTAFNRHEEVQTGRGEVFMHRLDAALTLLRTHPEIAPVYEGPYRRMLVRDFPYGIFYQVQPNRIVVVAIMDLPVARQPNERKTCCPRQASKRSPPTHPSAWNISIPFRMTGSRSPT